MDRPDPPGVRIDEIAVVRDRISGDAHGFVSCATGLRVT
jgi:hypothetical protein